MAHELSTNAANQAEMAYVGAKPWHGLGQELQQGASIEQWTQAAGMDWKIQRSKVRYVTERDGEPAHTIDDQHVLFRSDNQKSLAIVSDRFKIVQPNEVLEFFRDLTESAGWHLCTAGVLKEGRKFWAQAECGMADTVLGGDLVKGKLLLATACDGSMQTIVKNVTERVVCANTLAMAMGEGGKAIKTSHRSHFNAESVKAQMGVTVDNFAKFIHQARELAKYDMTAKAADQFMLDLFAPMADKLEDDDYAAKVRDSVGYRKVSALFDGQARGSNLAGVSGTAWGMLNAVTEYTDHHRGNSATTRDNRMDYAWFGEGDGLKTAAFDRALALLA
jgi:phage/plasmid-like protein (TIGR03299 family)